MTREDVRLWIAHQREGQARIRAEHRERPVEPQRSLARACALTDRQPAGEGDPASKWLRHRDVEYTGAREPSNAWASVTPVILPGHDDHNPNKTRKLIEKALAQAGIEQQCEFESSPLSYFPKSLAAHKYGRDKRPTGYIRPSHLLSQTAVHLKLRFSGGLEVPGPLVIGAGRHCGFGLMAGIDR